jgi:hypothetical protein
MKILSGVIFGSVFFFLFNTAHAEFPLKDFTRISGDALKTVLTGNVNHCSRDDGRKWDWSYYADGKVTGDDYRGNKDDGTWEINSDGDVCMDWKFEFRDVCRIIYQNQKNPLNIAYVGGTSGTLYTCNLKPIK